MINKLRRKFIAINMILVGVVIIVVALIININSYYTLKQELTSGLAQSLNFKDTNGILPEFPAIGDSGEHQDNGGSGSGNGSGKGALSRFSSLIYTVAVDPYGNVLFTGNNSVTIDDSVLSSAITKVMASDDSFGRLKDESLFYMKQTTIFATTKIALADSSTFYSAVMNTVLLTLLICVVSLTAFALISILLSNIAVKPVKTAWEQQQAFIADASHELKTPLTVILANTDILAAHPEATIREERKWIDSTLEEAGSMKSLVDELLFLAKSDAQKNQAPFTDVDFSDIVLNSVLQFEPVAFEADVTVESDVAPGITVHGDQAQLRRLTHILIDNAVKYAGKGGCVNVKLNKEDKNVRMSVKNTGDPIPQDDIPHLFERFYRSDKARTAGGGYGLGLAIAKTIAESHHGDISVTSSSDEGTEFILTLRTEDN